MARSVPVRVVLNGVLVGAALVGVFASRPAPATEHDGQGPWTPMVRRVDDALSRREFTAALKAANENYAAALGIDRWDGLVAAGDAYRRIGEATGLRPSFGAKAREVYLKALFRARQAGSIDGVLRTAEGFIALHDSEMVVHCLRVAERLAGRDRSAQAVVRAFAARLPEGGAAVTQTRR